MNNTIILVLNTNKLFLFNYNKRNLEVPIRVL